MPRGIAMERGIGAPDEADTFALPSLGLADPDSVTVHAMSRVRREREPARAPAVELDELFTNEELGQLGEAWLTVDEEDIGTIPSELLSHVLAALGIRPSSDEFEAILGSLGVDADGEITWEMFVNLMADLKAT